MNILIALLPNLLEFINEFMSREGRLPTAEELTVEIRANEDKYIAIGETWLREHPPGGPSHY
jgi:hypothetical protein